MQAALEMEEALYLQRQQELQRDLQIQRLLLQDRLEQQALMQASGPGSGLNAATLYDLHYGGGGLAAQLREEQMLMHHHDQLRRHQQVQHLQHQLQPNMAMSNALGAPEMTAEAIIADSLAANAMRRTPANSSQRAPTPSQRKRSFDIPQEEVTKTSIATKKARTASVTKDEEKKPKKTKAPPREPKETKATRVLKAPKAPKVAKMTKITNGGGVTIKDPAETKKKRGRPKGKKPMPTIKGHKILAGGVAKRAKTDNDSVCSSTELSCERELAKEALTALASAGPPEEPPVDTPEPEPEGFLVKGTVADIVAAAEAESKAYNAATCLVNFMDTAVWYDTEPEEDEYEEDEIIDLPGFQSRLPQLPKEPEYRTFVLAGRKMQVKECTHTSSSLPEDGSIISATGKSKTGLGMTVEYPYPVDTWWPSVSAIRKERRLHNEKSDEEDFNEEPVLTTEDAPFRADGPAIRKRLSQNLEPGVLEKLPHCRVHRLAMRSMKVASAPDHAFCWQVTENYCNEPMVCCSVCSSWRHAACGGHFKTLTIRDTINHEFAAVCDRCHEEKALLKQFPKADARLEKQRIEQHRRGLATSAVIRQASFAKHAGQFKWPLGSVSATHIGGHTRSVNSRHDKAEKQWSDMVTRLGRGYGYRPKERVKVRSRELERLLVSIEDSEGATDRHNMMVFLQSDTNGEFPAGYEQRRRNLFDPAEDESGDRGSPDGVVEVQDNTEPFAGRRAPVRKSILEKQQDPVLANQSVQFRCVRAGCTVRPRFDSMFCSDACGVAALQVDLLGALRCANDIHPALLRN